MQPGEMTNFDAVYQQIIAPAVVAAGLDPIRADEEKIGGTIHKPMFERLMLCHYAVADITGANPNVYYELGIRHAMRPRSTVILFAEGTSLPFDIALLRGIPYRTDDSGDPSIARRQRQGDHRRIARRARQSARRQPDLSTDRRHAAHPRSTTARPTCSASASTTRKIQGSPRPRPREKGADAVRAIAAESGAEQSARCRGRHRRRPFPVVARRQSL